MNEDLFKAIKELVPLVLGSTVLGNIIASKNTKKVTEQALIKIMADDRKYVDEQLKERDAKIDHLYKIINVIEVEKQGLVSENASIKWNLTKEREKNKVLRNENISLNERLKRMIEKRKEVIE